MNATPVTLTYVYGALSLLASSFFATLHFAYRLAGDAGIPRFTEKYPATLQFAAWTRHWSRFSAALLILWITLLLVSVMAWAPVIWTASWGGALARMVLLVLGVIILNRAAPIAIAESYADRIAATFLPLVVALTIALYPLAALLAKTQQFLIQGLLAKSDDAHRPSSEDEIMSLMYHADADDLEESEREMIRSVLEFGDTVTREIMTHRVDIVAFEHAMSITDCIEKSKQAAFSRFPVYAASLDDVRGVVHAKDLLRSLSEGKGNQPVAALCNKVTFVPETMPIDDLFHLLRSARAQLALVVDEYGGTAGLVSMEDIIEELVGEIHDEYDPADIRIQKQADGSHLVDAREPVSEINESLGINIPENDEYDSIGGYIFHQLGQIPGPGERIECGDCEIRIQAAMPHRIVNVRIIKKERRQDPT